MGSFANSLHIKSAKADEVSDVIRDLLLNEGYQLTDEEPSEEAMWGMSSTHRALYVAEAVPGWTSVLDSGLWDSTSLAAELSGRLETYTLQVLVNDSDSWHYLLFYDGEQLDEFDSSGGREATESQQLPPDLARLLAEGGPASMQQEIERRVQDSQRRAEEAMPPEVREAFQKMQQRTANTEETQRYLVWMQAHMQELMDAMKKAVLGSPPQAARIARDQLEPHAERLRPLLGHDVSQDRVLEVLGKQAVFAEEVLREFLKLLGIQPSFADLSYRYLEEWTASDLLTANIKVIGHLKFKRQ